MLSEGLGLVMMGCFFFCTQLSETHTARLLFLIHTTYFINIRFHIQTLSVTMSGCGSLEAVIQRYCPASAQHRSRHRGCCGASRAPGEDPNAPAQASALEGGGGPVPLGSRPSPAGAGMPPHRSIPRAPLFPRWPPPAARVTCAGRNPGEGKGGGRVSLPGEGGGGRRGRRR